MNILDLIVILILAYFIISGYFKGLLSSILEIGVFIMSIVIFRFLYPIISVLLVNTPIYENFKNWIGTSLSNYGISASSNVLIEVGIPEFLSEKITGLFGKNIIDSVFGNAIEYISNLAFNIVTGIVTFIVVIIIVSILVIFIVKYLKLITKLPVVRQINKIGGVLIGGFMGILFIWFIGIFILILVLFPKYEVLSNLIETSKIAAPLLENNYLLDLFLQLLKDIILK